jgi:hypothetical protein
MDTDQERLGVGHGVAVHGQDAHVVRLFVDVLDHVTPRLVRFPSTWIDLWVVTNSPRLSVSSTAWEPTRPFRRL